VLDGSILVQGHQINNIMSNSCKFCPVEKDCYYPYKPCECVLQRKFWNKERREKYDKEEDKDERINNIKKILK